MRALLPLVVAADPSERDAVVVELKAAQFGYLAPIVGELVPSGRDAVRQSSVAKQQGSVQRGGGSSHTTTNKP